MKEKRFGTKTFKKLLSDSLILLFVAAILVLPANAALQAVGPNDPANGFPYWYQDANGLKLAPCLAGTDGLADPNCVLLADPGYNPSLPISFGNNFPGEFFYWIADSDNKLKVGPNGGGKAVFRMALEGTFTTGTATQGQQMTFLRVNLKKMSGLTPNSVYTVTYPFGTFQFTSDALGNTITGIAGQAYRAEDGCLGAPCDFTLLIPATNTKIGQFLQAVSPAPPAGYIGNPATLQTITSGPNGNFFRIDGPDIGGKGKNTVQTNLWSVAGKIFSNPTPILTTISITPPAVTVPVGGTQQFTATALDQFSMPMAATFTWTTNDSAIGTIDPATGLFTANATGFVNVTATNGTSSANASVTVSAAGTVPVLTNITVTPVAPTITAGKIQQFTAAALDQYGNPIAVTIVWTVSDPFVGMINPSTGLFASMGVGSANVTATNGTVNGSSTVTVVSSALQGVGPADPANGFPLWYLDAGGTRLGQCIAINGTGPADPGCVVLADATYNPLLNLSFPTNFPGESFYWVADSDNKLNIGPGLGGKAIFRMALEGTFAFGTPQVGQQITFLRINMKKTSGLVPNSVYNVTYPFGKFQFATDASGNTIINQAGQAYRAEDGSFAPGAPDVFSALLPATNTNISLFLKAVSPAPPAGYIGDPAVLQTITPGPNGDFLRIDGPSIGGNGINTIQTNLWNVAGKLYTDPLMPSLYSIDPANNAINVPADKTIVATFSQDITPGTAYAGITLKETKSKVAVAFTKTIVKNVLFIDPVDKLQYERTYTVFLPQNAVEYADMSYLPRNYSSSFTVAKKNLKG